MKFKRGDRVRVVQPKDDKEFEARNASGPGWTPGMSNMTEEYVVEYQITWPCGDKGYWMGNYTFLEEWLEPAEELIYEI